MKSPSMLDMKRLQAAKPVQRSLLLAAASLLALNCTAAPMEAEDATTPNAGIVVAAAASQSGQAEDATTPNAGMVMPSDTSQSAQSSQSNLQQGFEAWPDDGDSAPAQRRQADTAAATDLDTLRHAAAMGDDTAGLQLVQQLVNRYETSGANDQLYEAMLWIDRFHSSDLIAHAPLVGHLASTQCTHRVVRYHWLCEKAE